MRAEEVPESLLGMPLPSFDHTPWVAAPAPGEARVALISTAGLMHDGDPPFTLGSADYRVVDAESERPLRMSHISTNFDRSGFLRDPEVVFPLQRLSELERGGLVGSRARYHYSFMGATDPADLEPAAADLAEVLQGDGVDAAVLAPV